MNNLLNIIGAVGCALYFIGFVGFMIWHACQVDKMAGL